MSDRVVICLYDPEWQVLFAQLGAALREALGPVALRIDHIGSTSIQGLDAKPIIDVQVSVADFEPFDAYCSPLERLGFAFRPNNPDRDRRYFRETAGMRRTHIHVRRAGSWYEQFPLLFRDYLRVHQDDAREYAALKYRLAEQFGADRAAYTDAKGPFIWEIMAKADQWCRETGWRPWTSDA